jgi:outer membrane protein OmpA-like peptidoglycan-associated protein
MKKLLLYCFTCLIIQAALAQTRTHFKLTDTAFTVGSVYAPSPLYFDIGSHGRELMEGQQFIDSLADFIIAHPGIIIQIGSHTDQRGGDSSNLKLSYARAHSMQNLLLKKGIAAWQIPAVGYGETQQLTPESVIKATKDVSSREKLYEKERRTEFKILRLPIPTFSLTDSLVAPGSIYRAAIIFDLAKATIRPESFPLLDSLVDFLNRHPNLVISISNHTDTRVSDAYSSCLSCNRARSISDYLISKGIAKERIIHKGWQGKAPLISEFYILAIKSKDGQEQLHQINRRTEIQIMQQQ